jgi:predicted amidohydrolase
MDRTVVAAVVQMESGLDRGANLAAAEGWLREAASAGAQLVVLPELFNCLGPLELVARAAEAADGPTATWLADQARTHGIVLVGGSFAEREGDRVFNTSLLFGPDGTLLACYRKMHLFDLDVPGQAAYCESHWLASGDAVVATPLLGSVLGQAICYDLRFPELFRALVDAGSEILALPSAFTRRTGEAHWEVLVRARAIENQCYLLAANQWGEHGGALTTFGHSMIVDPWGEVLAQIESQQGIAIAELRSERLRAVRRMLPVLDHRRLAK